jgi:hypothetical protein
MTVAGVASISMVARADSVTTPPYGLGSRSEEQADNEQ